MKIIQEPYILDILRLFDTIHEEAWLVGGSVRDMLMDREIHDYDITTSALPDTIVSLFSKAGYPLVFTGRKHGTITVMAQGNPVEITTYRTESIYKDHRTPSAVSFTRCLAEDLKRRDFTINAIAWHPERGYYDPYGGSNDIQNRVIRCVGDASQRMQEDALRILRALRFHCSLQFSIDPATIQAIQSNAAFLSYISRERIRDELCKLLMQDMPNTLQLLKDMHVLDEIFPGYCALTTLDQNNPWHIYDLFTHTDQALNHTVGYPLESKLAIILHDIGKPSCMTTDADGISHFYGHAMRSVTLAKQYLKDLAFDNKTIQTILTRIQYHDDHPQAKGSSMRRFVAKFNGDIEEAMRTLDVQLADDKAKNPVFAQKNINRIWACKQLLLQMKETETTWTLRDLAINGNDLLACGLSGKQIGSMLRELLDYVLQDPARNTKEQLLAYVQTHASINEEE